MKYIQKQAEPLELIQFKNQINDNWKPNYADLYKPPIKQALMQEQGFICCYCEQRLDPEDCHIEHFRPQSDPSVDPLDFRICSAPAKIKCKKENLATVVTSKQIGLTQYY